MDQLNRISITPTVARQTQQPEFGSVMKNTLQAAANVGGSLLGNIPGGALLSAAVNNITALTNQPGGAKAASYAATGVTSVGGTGAVGTAASAAGISSPTAQTLSTSNNVGGGELGGMIGEMRAEADRSMMMQMKMQDESREYNTLSNVLKVRHDSAKSAINNIR